MIKKKRKERLVLKNYMYLIMIIKRLVGFQIMSIAIRSKKAKKIKS